jgi:hypothetical protein
MSTHAARCLEVSPSDGGAPLTAAASLAATTLTLVSVDDFKPEGGELVYLDPADDVTEVTVAYTGKDDDADTLTLAAPLAHALDADAFITAAPRTREKRAVVKFGPDEKSVTVRVHHALRDRLADGVREPADQEAVEVTVDASGSATLTNVLGEEPDIDPTYIQVPYGQFTLDAAQSIPNLTYTALGPWDEITEPFSSPDIIPFGTSIAIYAPGFYQIVATAQFATGSGTRRVQLATYAGFTSTPFAEVVVPAAGTQMQLQVTGHVWVSEEAVPVLVQVRVYQGSGGSLNVLAATDYDTQVSVIRLG